MTDPLSARIADLAGQLHTLTNDYVSTEDASSRLDLQSLLGLQKLYLLLGLELGTVPLATVDIDKVVELLEIISPPNTPGNDAVVTLISYYLLLFVYSRLCRGYISRTIESLNQLTYWDGLHYSSSAKILYFVQTSPVKLLTTWRNYKPAMNTDGEEPQSFVEEDNSVYHLFEQARQLVLNVANSVVAAANKVSPSMMLHKEMGPRKLAAAVYHIPYSVAKKDVRMNRRAIRSRMDGYARTIGELLSTVPQENPQSIDDISVETLVVAAESILSVNSRDTNQKAKGGIPGRINSLLCQLKQFESHKETSSTAPPGFYTRWWPGILLALNFGPSTLIKAYRNWREIVEWFRLNFVETVVGFWGNWVVKPIGDMLSVLRHDDGSDLSITTKESLQLDLDLLERMVVDYVVDYEHKDGAQVQLEIHNAISNGNLTMLMLSYEQDLRTPFRAAIKGSLVRALLIQIQKTKVDGAVAISGIDKLLKSQQLVFGVVSISPLLVILYQAWQAVRRMRSRPVKLHGKQVNVLCLKLMNSVEKWLLTDNDLQLVKGHIFLEAVRLLLWTPNVIPRELQEEWRRDIHELALGGGRETMDRVWRMYGPYLR